MTAHCTNSWADSGSRSHHSNTVSPPSDTEAAQLWLKVLADLANEIATPSNLATEERKTLALHKRDRNITILPADIGRFTVALNRADYHNKVTDRFFDTNTYNTLMWDPTWISAKTWNGQSYWQAIILPTVPRGSHQCIYGLPKIHEERAPLISSINSVTYNISNIS